MKNIVTIMNFVRGIDQRYQDILFPTAKTQFDLLNNTDLKATFLLQHDAVIDDAYTELFSKRGENIEIGLWLETCKSCVLEAGVEWRGRPGFDFDWYSNVDTVVGYTTEEKIKLIDTAMNRFKAVYGFYPKTVGAWVLDSFTVEYLGDKYGVVCTANCKDQWGTDGYTLFGGYYDNAYYPCKQNVLCPAQTEGEQINVPHFKLLGCDPLYQYDCFVWAKCHVWTLEPWYLGDDALPEGGGSDPKWIDWYFNQVFESGNGGSFNYAQVGQENSFCWAGVERGYLHQIERVKEMKARGVIEDMTLAEAGQWFKDTYKMSPPCTHTALSDWRGEGNKSVWYYCKNYRVGLFITKEAVYIRDMHIYDEKYPSIYNNDVVCTEADCYFDVPTVMNGVAWSEKGRMAGIYLIDAESGRRISADDVKYMEHDGGFELTVISGEREIVISGFESKLSIKGDGIALSYEYVKLLDDESISVSGNRVDFVKKGYEYSLTLDGGVIEGNIVHFDKEISVGF